MRKLKEKVQNVCKKVGNWFRSVEVQAGLVAVASAAQVGIAYADVNDTINNVLKFVFGGVTLVGIFMAIVGVVQLVRYYMAVSGGDQAQPGQLGKAIGMLIGGIVCVFVKTILSALGVPVDNFQWI